MPPVSWPGRSAAPEGRAKLSIEALAWVQKRTGLGATPRALRSRTLRTGLHLVGMACCVGVRPHSQIRTLEMARESRPIHER